MYHYPPLDESSLRQIKHLCEENPDYFDHPDCPYSEETKVLFKIQSPRSDFDNDVDIDYGELLDEDNIISQIEALYKHLQEFGRSMRESDSASEKNTYFKLSVSLLEKLIDMRKDVVNIKQMESFYDLILEIMEDELTPDQKTGIMRKLRGYLNREQEDNEVTPD